ncbi:WD40 repeat domain-containing protein, partial [Streptomyces sp. NPDC052676]
TASGAPQVTLAGHTDTVLAVAFSPDGRSLTSGSTDQTIRRWNVAPTTPRKAISKICHTIGRHVTAQEHSAYAPNAAAPAACPD